MKSLWLATVGIAVALALSACSGGSPSASPASPAAGSAAAPAATTAPAASPANPTVAPTVAPTTAPAATAEPTTAPTVVATVAPTMAPEATEGSTAIPAEPTKAAAQPAAATGPSVSQGDIRKMAVALAAVKSYRLKVTNTAAKAEDSTTLDMDIVRPDRMHMKTTFGGNTIEAIQIGADEYSNFGGKWTKTTKKAGATPEMGDPLASANPDAMVQDLNDEIKNGGSITKGGLSTVDGTPCQQWTMTTKVESDSNSTTATPTMSTATMCVGLQNNLPLQVTTNDSNDKVLMKFYDYNKPITINPPI